MAQIFLFFVFSSTDTDQKLSATHIEYVSKVELLKAKRQAPLDYYLCSCETNYLPL